MKVICIDANLLPQHFQQDQLLQEGETYTVSGSYVDKKNSHEYYELAEKQVEPIASYRDYRFLPLSDICEEDEYRIRMAMLTGKGI